MSIPKRNQRIIVVLGATGNQGGGVLHALLQSKSWIVRAGTRDTSLAKAQKLLSERQTDDDRLELVTADVYELDSLIKAFSGAYGVFAVTSERHPRKKIVDEAEMHHEIDAGRNIIRAAQECGIEHFVFSSLPDMMHATSGKFPKLFHMNNKHAVEMMAREALPERCTFLVPGFFYTNLQWKQYSRLQDNGVVRFCYPIPSGQVAQWTDSEYDMGLFAAKIFDLGVDQTRDKTYLAMGDRITPQQMAETFTKVTGKPAIHVPTSVEEFGDLTAPLVGPAFKEDAMQMMQWAAVAPAEKVAYGSLYPEEDDSARELGLTASSFEEWLRRSGWFGPEHE